MVELTLDYGILIGLKLSMQKSDRDEPVVIDTADNLIGKIPAVILYNSKSHKKGLVNQTLQTLLIYKKLSTMNCQK